AAEESVGRRLRQDDDRQVGVFACGPADERERTLRVAGAGDDEQVGRRFLERGPTVFHPLDEPDELDRGVVRKRRDDRGFVDAGVERNQRSDRTLRHCSYGAKTLLPSAGFLPAGFASVCGRSRNRIVPFWTPKMNRVASLVGTRRM